VSSGTTCTLTDSGIAAGTAASAVFLTSNYTNATTVLSNVTGISFPVAANTNYVIVFDGQWTGSAATAVMAIAWTGPAAPTSVNYNLTTTSSTLNTVSEGGATTFGTTLTSGIAANATDDHFRTVLTLINGANAGTVQLQAAAGGVGTITILPSAARLN
jgi:hypothetical protein